MRTREQLGAKKRGSGVGGNGGTGVEAAGSANHCTGARTTTSCDGCESTTRTLKYK